MGVLLPVAHGCAMGGWSGPMKMIKRGGAMKRDRHGARVCERKECAHQELRASFSSLFASSRPPFFSFPLHQKHTPLLPISTAPSIHTHTHIHIHTRNVHRTRASQPAVLSQYAAIASPGTTQERIHLHAKTTHAMNLLPPNQPG